MALKPTLRSIKRARNSGKVVRGRLKAADGAVEPINSETSPLFLFKDRGPHQEGCVLQPEDHRL